MFVVYCVITFVTHHVTEFFMHSCNDPLVTYIKPKIKEIYLPSYVLLLDLQKHNFIKRFHTLY